MHTKSITPASNIIPKRCKHLAIFKHKNGLNCYTHLQNCLKSNPNNPKSNPLVIDDYHRKKVVPRCDLCCGYRGRFYICLVCSCISCCLSPDSNHAHLHSQSVNGHDISVDVDRAELYCSVCCDQVYDPDFDRVLMLVSLKFEELVSFSGNSNDSLSYGVLKRKRLEPGLGVESDIEERVISGGGGSGSDGRKMNMNSRNGVFRRKRLVPGFSGFESDFEEGMIKGGSGGGSDSRRVIANWSNGVKRLGQIENGVVDSRKAKNVVVLRRDPRSKMVYPLGLRGLNNLGSTCFMNSVLQALFHAPPIRNYFLSDRHHREFCRKRSADQLCLPCDIDDLFSAVFSGERSPYSPAQFLHSWWLHSENHATYEQQDAHEFFISILDQIHEKESKNLKLTVDVRDCECIAHQVFSGLLRSDVTCTTCGSISTTYDPCLDISLDLDGQIVSPEVRGAGQSTSSLKDNAGMSTLSSCLDHFTRSEKLGSDQKLYCENCQERQESLKQMSFRQLPLVLCLHIKRFEHSHIRKMSRKIDRYLQFPFSLDMGPYMSSTIVRSRHGNRIFGFEDDDADTISEYEIFAVVTHSGMLESGHYVTFLRLHNQWYKCDDAWIMEVDEATVRASQCYMVYYLQKMLHHKTSDDLSCLPMSPRRDALIPLTGCCR